MPTGGPGGWTTRGSSTTHAKTKRCASRRSRRGAARLRRHLHSKRCGPHCNLTTKSSRAPMATLSGTTDAPRTSRKKLLLGVLPQLLGQQGVGDDDVGVVVAIALAANVRHDLACASTNNSQEKKGEWLRKHQPVHGSTSKHTWPFNGRGARSTLAGMTEGTGARLPATHTHKLRYGATTSRLAQQASVCARSLPTLLSDPLGRAAV